MDHSISLPPVIVSPGQESALVAYKQGVAAWHQGDVAAAASFALQAIQNFPDDPAYFNLLGVSYNRLGKLDDSVAAFRQALKVNPKFADAEINLSWTLSDLGQLSEAERIARQAVEHHPSHVEGLCNLGIVLARRRKAEEAKTIFLHLLQLQPNNLAARRNLGHVYREMGQFEDARASYLSVLRLHPRDGQCYEKLSQMRRYTKDDMPKCSALEAILMDRTLPAGDRIGFHFALGKMYEDIGHYNLSFAHYRQANDSMPGSFDRKYCEQSVNKLIGYFTPERFANRRDQGSNSEQPVFLVGMPRSGTTLVEQILASHPQVYGAGELRDIPALMKELVDGPVERVTPLCLDTLDAADVKRFAEEYLRFRAQECGDALRVIDKMPTNFFSLGLIAILFPRARVIHCRRNPIDIGTSCYASNFASRLEFAKNLGDIGFYYRQYERLMKHWQAVLPLPMLEVHYEQLVTNQVTVTHRLLEFCGLPWDDRCLKFHQTNRHVSTVSDWQVRQPMYATAVGRWRKFEPFLGPLLEELNPLESKVAT